MPRHRLLSKLQHCSPSCPASTGVRSTRSGTTAEKRVIGHWLEARIIQGPTRIIQGPTRIVQGPTRIIQGPRGPGRPQMVDPRGPRPGGRRSRPRSGWRMGPRRGCRAGRPRRTRPPRTMPTTAAAGHLVGFGCGRRFRCGDDRQRVGLAPAAGDGGRRVAPGRRVHRRGLVRTPRREASSGGGLPDPTVPLAVVGDEVAHPRHHVGVLDLVGLGVDHLGHHP